MEPSFQHKDKQDEEAVGSHTSPSLLGHGSRLLDHTSQINHHLSIINHTSATVRVRRIAYSSLAKFGCLLGGVAMVLPGLVCGLGGVVLVRVLRVWLESWQQFNLSILGQNVGSFDLINALRLTALLERLRILDATGPLALLGVAVAVALLGGLLLAVIVVGVGLAYNVLAWLTGGIMLELEGGAVNTNDTD